MFIIFPGPLRRPPQMNFLFGAPSFFSQMTFHQQPVDIFLRIQPAILMNSVCALAQCQGSHSIILRYHNIHAMA